MSGIEPQKRTVKSKKPRAGARVEDVPEELRPKILVPTPAQLASGQRLVSADPAIWPDSVARAHRKALENGWLAMVTYSHFLDVPPYQGKHAGQWVEKFSLAVRVCKMPVLAYAVWHGQEEEGWSANAAGAWLVGVGPAVTFGVMEFGQLLDGRLNVVPQAIGLPRLMGA